MQRILSEISAYRKQQYFRHHSNVVEVKGAMYRLCAAHKIAAQGSRVEPPTNANPISLNVSHATFSVRHGCTLINLTRKPHNHDARFCSWS
jgi:hypothetical protein